MLRQLLFYMEGYLKFSEATHVALRKDFFREAVKKGCATVNKLPDELASPTCVCAPWGMWTSMWQLSECPLLAPGSNQRVLESKEGIW